MQGIWIMGALFIGYRCLWNVMELDDALINHTTKMVSSFYDWILNAFTWVLPPMILQNWNGSFNYETMQVYTHSTKNIFGQERVSIYHYKTVLCVEIIPVLITHSNLGCDCFALCGNQLTDLQVVAKECTYFIGGYRQVNLHLQQSQINLNEIKRLLSKLRLCQICYWLNSN